MFGLRQGRGIRPVALGLFVGAVALIALYFFAPVRPTQVNRFGPSARGADKSIFVATPVNGQQNTRQTATTPEADTSSVVDTTPSAKQTPIGVPTATVGNSQAAFLLLGYEGSESAYSGEYNTDSIMVAVVDPAHRTVTLLSLPRDSWVPLYFNGKTAVYNKVNTAYGFATDPSLYPDRLSRYTGQQGPGNFAMDTISRLVGIPITYYAAVDFQGFRDMVDAVGGIDVNVPDGFSTLYPKNDNPSIDASWITLRFTPGLQHMDGERALEYARSREVIDNPNESGDFARSRRQRLIMEAFKNRVVQPQGLLHLPQLISIASQHLDTNYAVPDVAQLSQLILGWKDVKIYQTALTTGNYLEEGTGPNGTYIVVPSSPDHSWAQIRAFTHRLWKDPALGTQMAATTIVVQNDSGEPGLAGQVGDALIKLGYVVGDPTTGPLRKTSQLVDGTDGTTSPLVGQLEHDLGLPDLSLTDPSNAAANTLVLELGEDATQLRITVLPDPSAPSSTVGVVKFGVWPYTPPSPAPNEAPVQSRSRAVASPTPIETTPTPRPAETPTPQPANSNIVVVPQLVGLPEGVAQQEITNAGLATTYVNEQTINQVVDRALFQSIQPGHVLSQSPLPDSRVPRGTTVYLAVRKS